MFRLSTDNTTDNTFNQGFTFCQIKHTQKEIKKNRQTVRWRDRHREMKSERQRKRHTQTDRQRERSGGEETDRQTRDSVK